MQSFGSSAGFLAMAEPPAKKATSKGDDQITGFRQSGSLNEAFLFQDFGLFHLKDQMNP